MTLSGMLHRAGAVIDTERALIRSHLRPIAERLVVTAVASALMLRPQALIFALPLPPLTVTVPVTTTDPATGASVTTTVTKAATLDDLVPGSTDAIAASNGPRVTAGQTSACFGCGPVPGGLFALLATRDRVALQLVNVLYPTADAVADAFKLDVALRLRAALTVDLAAPTQLTTCTLPLPLDPLTGGAPAPATAALLASGGLVAVAAQRIAVLLATIQDIQSVVDECFSVRGRIARIVRGELQKLKAAKFTVTNASAHAATAALSADDIPSLTEVLVYRMDLLLRKRSPAEAAPALAAVVAAGLAASTEAAAGVLTVARDSSLNLMASLVPLAADFDYLSEMYRRALSKRLLLERYVSLGFEESYVVTLGQRCGMRLSQVDVLINDVKSSIEAHDVFLEWIATDRAVNPAAPALNTLPAAGSDEAIARFGPQVRSLKLLRKQTIFL